MFHWFTVSRHSKVPSRHSMFHFVCRYNNEWAFLPIFSFLFLWRRLPQALESQSQQQQHQPNSLRHIAYIRYRETQYAHSVALRAVVMAYLSNCLYSSHSAFVLFCFVFICFHSTMRMCSVRPDRDQAERWTIDALNDDVVLKKNLKKRNMLVRARRCLCEHYFVSLNGN